MTWQILTESNGHGEDDHAIARARGAWAMFFLRDSFVAVGDLFRAQNLG